VTQTEVPSFNDTITLVAQLVPDIPKPSEIIFEIEHRDRVLWLEGWCDGCLANKGFPPKGEGMLQEKLDHIKEITPEFLKKRAMEKGMKMQYSGFIPLDGKKFLYGVSWAIFIKQT
jgi:hypothetical protein